LQARRRGPLRSSLPAPATAAQHRPARSARPSAVHSTAQPPFPFSQCTPSFPKSCLFLSLGRAEPVSPALWSTKAGSSSTASPPESDPRHAPLLPSSCLEHPLAASPREPSSAAVPALSSLLAGAAWPVLPSWAQGVLPAVSQGLPLGLASPGSASAAPQPPCRDSAGSGSGPGPGRPGVCRSPWCCCTCCWSRCRPLSPQTLEAPAAICGAAAPAHCIRVAASRQSKLLAEVQGAAASYVLSCCPLTEGLRPGQGASFLLFPESGKETPQPSEPADTSALSAPSDARCSSLRKAALGTARGHWAANMEQQRQLLLSQ